MEDTIGTTEYRLSSPTEKCAEVKEWIHRKQQHKRGEENVPIAHNGVGNGKLVGGVLIREGGTVGTDVYCT